MIERPHMLSQNEEQEQEDRKRELKDTGWEFGAIKGAPRERVSNRDMCMSNITDIVLESGAEKHIRC